MSLAAALAVLPPHAADCPCKAPDAITLEPSGLSLYRGYRYDNRHDAERARAARCMIEALAFEDVYASLDWQRRARFGESVIRAEVDRIVARYWQP